MTVVAIRFGMARSPRFPRVCYLASTLPSYKSAPNQFSIEESVNAVNWRTIFAIWGMVSDWKSCSAEIDGAPATPRGMFEIQAVFQCHDTRVRLGVGDDHCLGKDTPSDEPAYLGCRFARGVRMVRYDDTYYLPPEWWRFGVLSPDSTSFLVDKDEILRRVKEQNRASVGTLCPTWSLPRIEAVVKYLPSVLKIGPLWKLRCSGVTGSAVGVEPVYPMMLGRLNMNDILEDGK